jgi:DNA polymerase sigma
LTFVSQVNEFPTLSGYPLQALAKALHQQKWLFSMQVIETAKVPVIKIATIPELIPTDITFNDDISSGTTYITSGLLLTHSGMAACEVVKGFIQVF